MGAAVDASMATLLNECLEESIARQWYCFDEVALRGFSTIPKLARMDFSDIIGRVRERCYQIRTDKDESGNPMIICLMKKGPESFPQMSYIIKLRLS